MGFLQQFSTTDMLTHLRFALGNQNPRSWIIKPSNTNSFLSWQQRTPSILWEPT